jgi:hypothetical protein
LIVGLNSGQFVEELFTAVELADLGNVNFGRRRVKPRVGDLTSPLMSSH